MLRFYRSFLSYTIIGQKRTVRPYALLHTNGEEVNKKKKLKQKKRVTKKNDKK